ncbi:type II toxin-antitoxin system RelE/ParE family toxin [Actinomyces ruminis]|uniref:Type II toxin-antitoxin system RelE/ParE family toxin n=1 Tax=Actinomyces ruminis TaxID=1937003 RepID=A0ABX4MGW0_9ACTO|nr:type II toxin-antitoxin system RelE/ParE family toxin [Actinomyces ruminis]PHP53364.1 type II toxin-antitoxin system RelE/ParE family toxin [Actinomyces ruminis]
MPTQHPKPEAKARRLVYSQQAQVHLADLYRWIADESGFPSRALTYVSALMDRCEALVDFSMVGRARDDIRPGVRTVGFRRRAVIAFAVTDEAVEILGVYYGGRDHETLMRADED